MENSLPKNWVETPLTDVSNIVTGRKDANHATEDGKYVFFTCAIGQMLSPDYSFDGEVILLPGNGANVGELFYYNGKFQAYQRTYVIQNIALNGRFLFYHLKAFWKSRNSNMQYGSATNYIKIGNFNDYKISFPPLAEQERIVVKLDALFAQQEVMKKALSRIPDLLKDFGQQVLTQAVTGKLTESWREGRELEEWKEKKLSDISSSKLGKMLDGVKNTGELVNYVGNVNVRWFNINFSNMKKLKIEPNDITKYTLLKGDVLVCEGGEPGRAAIWKYERNDVIFQKALHRIRLHENVLPEFFLYNLKVDSLNNKLTQLFTGTTIKHLTGRSFSTYRVNIPSVQEQQEIVSRVESLFTKADDIEKRYKNLKEKIDQLPQALLHKAFKGELVEQLSTDGDAKDLLKEILALKKVGTIKRKVVKNYKQNDEVLGKVAEGK